jgi:hypothetical protein
VHCWRWGCKCWSKVLGFGHPNSGHLFPTMKLKKFTRRGQRRGRGGWWVLAFSKIIKIKLLFRWIKRESNYRITECMVRFFLVQLPKLRSIESKFSTKSSHYAPIFPEKKNSLTFLSAENWLFRENSADFTMKKWSPISHTIFTKFSAEIWPFFRNFFFEWHQIGKRSLWKRRLCA